MSATMVFQNEKWKMIWFSNYVFLKATGLISWIMLVIYAIIHQWVFGAYGFQSGKAAKNSSSPPPKKEK